MNIAIDGYGGGKEGVGGEVGVTIYRPTMAAEMEVPGLELKPNEAQVTMGAASAPILEVEGESVPKAEIKKMVPEIISSEST